jgi:DNA-3-methyladenine glycosylase I
MNRCAWPGADPLYVSYHDQEWGVPVYDDRLLFAKLILDGAQAGLSWITILRKRDGYYAAFDNFDKNAQAYLQLKEEEGSFSDFLWSFVDGKPIQNELNSLSQIPAKTPESEALSKALKKRGFSFVGPTIVYAFMQAVGMVNDHVIDCFRYEEVKALSGG